MSELGNCVQSIKPALKPLEISTNRKDKSEVNGETSQLPESSVASVETSAPSVKVVPAGTKTKNVTKGFDLSADFKECLKVDTGEASPRSQSPISDRLSPTVNETAEAAWDAETTDKKASKAKTDKSAGNEDVVVKDAGKTPSKAKESRVNAETEYQRERGQQKGLLHMVVIGHVDAGKSTLMGHLLYSLGQVNQKTMHKYEQESKKLGKQSFVYAWVLDETGEERSRGITMDVGQSRFETKTKTVILLDAPGHKDFIPNMITGASQADVAVLVVDATRGEFETGFESKGQTREHALLVRSLGVSQLAVVVNKLDMVSWSEERFNEIVSTLKTFLRQAGFRENDIVFVPCSGLTGENLTSPPKEDALKQWYKGPFLLDVIDNFKSPERPVSKPFRLPVGDVFKGTGSGFCVAGRIETGMLQVGDRVLVLPQNEAAQIKGITVDESPMQTAFAGDQIVASLSGIDMQNVCIGSIICDPSNPVSITSKIEARIVVFNIKVPITVGFPVILHYQCLAEQAVITKLLAQLHKSTGEITKTRPRCLTKNSNAVVVIEVSRPICIELYRDVKELGRFMLRVNGVTIAAGLVTKIY